MEKGESEDANSKRTDSRSRGGGGIVGTSVQKGEETGHGTTRQNALAKGLDKVTNGTGGELEGTALCGDRCGEGGGRSSDDSKRNDGGFGEHVVKKSGQEKKSSWMKR
jgi:hypothetical protein